jgi:CheY-like chemotaxis protein
LKLLHVEDDRTQRVLIAHHLGTMREFAFMVAAAESEDEALRQFGEGGVEFVILDYHLTQGDGLSCLHKLRQRDPIVPIVAISGEAAPEIAAELVQAGADDYISKDELTSKHLSQSVRAALARADAFRHYEPGAISTLPSEERDRVRRSNGPSGDEHRQVAGLLQQICQDFATRAGADLLARLEDFEAAARHAQLTPGQIQRLFDRVWRQLKQTSENGQSGKILLRPIMLEILLRLFGQASTPTRV